MVFNDPIDAQIDNGCYVCMTVVPIYLKRKPAPAGFYLFAMNQLDEVIIDRQIPAPLLRGDLTNDPPLGMPILKVGLKI